MRKIIFSIAGLVIVALILGPFAVGIWFQKNYRNLISFYNSPENIHLTILDYQRNWFSSDLTLEVQVNQKYLNWIEDEESITQFSKIIIKQHVQHGPIILQNLKNVAHIFGLAAIQNKIAFSSNQNISPLKIESETFFSYLGNYFNHLLISGLNISHPNTSIHAGIKNMTADFWVFPRQQRFKGDLELTRFFIKDTDDLLAIPFAKINLDQYLDKHNVFLGSGSIDLSEILFQETDEKDIRITHFYAEGFTEADDDFLNASRKISIKNIEFEDQLLGPVEMEVNFKQFYLPAIHDLFASYKDIIQNGEVYQGQLKQKISVLLPKIVRSGSSIQLEKLNVTSAEGNISAKGTFEWPEKNVVSPSDLREIIMTGQAQLDVTVSKKLLSKIIHVVSSAPDFIRDVAAPQKKLLINTRNEMEFAMQRNAVFIDYLGEGGYISKKAEDILVQLNKDLVPMSDYTAIVKDLFLDRQIALVVSYQLCWQYSQILKPYDFLKSRVSEFQKIAEQQIKDKFAEVLKKGYVSESVDDYSAKLKWSAHTFTSNGLQIN